MTSISKIKITINFTAKMRAPFVSFSSFNLVHLISTAQRYSKNYKKINSSHRKSLEWKIYGN